MEPDEFCRWLQGFAELTKKRPDDEQWQSIKEHLQTVYLKVTPPVKSSPTVDKETLGIVLREPRRVERVRLC